MSIVIKKKMERSSCTLRSTTDNALKQQDGSSSKLSASTTPVATTKRANRAVAESMAMFASANKKKGGEKELKSALLVDLKKRDKKRD